jgi:signal transduction histidine kinase
VLLHKTLKSSTLKLAFVYVVVFCSAIFALLGYVYLTTASYLHDRFDSSIGTEGGLLVKAFERGGRDALVELIKRRTGDEFFADWAYLVVDAGSAYVAGNLISWPQSLNGAQGWGNLSSSESPSGATGRHALRVTYRNLPDGSHLLVGRDYADLDRLGSRIATGLVTAAVLFLALAAAAGISTARRSVARIEAINATSRKIMQAGLGERIPLRGTRDEWDELAENLNSMLARIERLTESTREVADNVAHDLRTPLTRLRGRLERAIGHQPDLAQYRAVVGDAIAELDGLLATFSSLLRISRIEMRDRRAAFRLVDLTEIVREVADLFDPTAEEAAVRLRLREGGQAPVIGDRDLLFEAIANLTDNAIKHGGSGGEVTIAVAHDRDGPVFSVCDRGPGIPLEERDHVVRRFYRLERSRHSPGNGLGLSLVAAVANLHGANLRMADNSPGLSVTLHFPHP